MDVGLLGGMDAKIFKLRKSTKIAYYFNYFVIYSDEM